MEHYDFIVIGAGYAGLTATRKLLQANKKVLLLEARDRVGGRVYTKTLDDGSYVDLGGAWVGPTQDKLYELAREFGVETFKTWDTGKSTFNYKGKTKRYSGIIPPLSIPALLSLDFAMKKMNRLSQSINLEKPWLTPNAQYWDSMTLETWMRKEMNFASARCLFNIAAESIWACHPNEISMLHALFYTKSGQNLDVLINIKGGAQEERFVGGAQQPASKLAAAIQPQNIRLNSVVKTILQEDDKVIVKGLGFEFSANRIVVALPPTLAGRIDYYPLMPANREQLTQRIPMGTVTKTFAIYDKPFWRDAGLNGLAASDSGHTTVTFDNSPKDGSKGILMGFVLANQARDFSSLSAEERRASILKSFATFYGEKALHPIQYLDHTWADEEFTRGCYAGVMPTGAWTSLGKSLREPVGRIHWAGTETSDIWNGYIDGAIRSGERVAREVLEK